MVPPRRVDSFPCVASIGFGGNLSGLFAADLVPKTISGEQKIAVVLGQIKNLNVRLMSNVRSRVLRNGSAVSEFLVKLMEVELFVLESEVTD